LAASSSDRLPHISACLFQPVLCLRDGQARLQHHQRDLHASGFGKSGRIPWKKKQ
jgi:hypothetical protein